MDVKGSHLLNIVLHNVQLEWFSSLNYSMRHVIGQRYEEFWAGLEIDGLYPQVIFYSSASTAESSIPRQLPVIIAESSSVKHMHWDC